MKLFPMLSALVSLSLTPLCADTVVVLPFTNTSPTRNLDWIGESVCETIREALATQGLVALDRGERQEAFRRLGVRLDAHPTRATVIKIGQALDADQVIYGDYELIPGASGATSTRGSLRITVHILDLKKMKQGPEFTHTAPLEDLAASQAHLAWQTLQFLAPNGTPSEAEFKRQWPEVRVAAIENYMRGLLAPNPEQKQKLFLEAFRLEPGFSDAAYQLGLLAYSRRDYKNAVEWLQKVAKSDVHFRHAMFVLGICRYHSGDYPAAQAAFESIVEEVPLNEVYNNLGAAQSRRDQQAAVVNFNKAIEGDSSDPVYHFNAGYALWKLAKFDEAAERFRAVLDREPQDSEARMMLGRCLKKTPARGLKNESLERLKTNYEESAYWQLKAVLQPNKQ